MKGTRPKHSLNNKHNIDNAPFGKLAAELRNQIYEYVLIHDEPICITTIYHGANRPIRMRMKNQAFNSRPLSLLAVCRQTQEECTELFYSNNIFQLKSRVIDRGLHQDITGLSVFIPTLRTCVQRHLRHIEVVITCTLSFSGGVPTGLLNQLRHIERCALRNPHIRVECLAHLDLWHRFGRYHAAAHLEDMSDWYASKYAAKRVLGTFKKSDPDGRRRLRRLRSSRAFADGAHLSDVLDLYVSAKGTWLYDT